MSLANPPLSCYSNHALIIREGEKPVKRLVTFISAVLAGTAISIGGAVFLCTDSRTAGAALFSVGLFAVCTLGLDLFTGRVCYIFQNPPAYALNCGLIWLGNLTGALISGTALRLTRLDVAGKAAAVSEAKLSDGPLSVFILAVFCNILIYLSVESYRENPHQLGKYLGLFLGVVVFVQAGFEHCVANMFYFTAAGAWSGKTVLYLIIMTLGNTLGGVLIPLFKKLRAKTEA